MTVGESDSEPEGDVLTLEPLIEAVRQGLEGSGWELSGLQKTTSHEFEGRWAGETSRSAYLFFHRDGLTDAASIDIFLDETSKGLRGNLALVVDGPLLGEMADAGAELEALAVAAGEALPEGYRRPITLRLRVAGPDSDASEADSEVRFKVHIPVSAVEAGSSAIQALAAAVAGAFDNLLEKPVIRGYLALHE